MCHSLKCILLLVLYFSVPECFVFLLHSHLFIVFLPPIVLCKFLHCPNDDDDTLPHEMNGHHRTIITLAVFIAGWEQARTLTRPAAAVESSRHTRTAMSDQYLPSQIPFYRWQ